MVFQMQFVSLLRLMEANITEPFMHFLDSLKWLNLHFEVDLSFFNCDSDEVCTTTVRAATQVERAIEQSSEKRKRNATEVKVLHVVCWVLPSASAVATVCACSGGHLCKAIVLI